MKKIISMFLVAAMVWCFFAGVLVLAEENDTEVPIPEIIKNQGDITPDDDIYNKELYDESLLGYDFSDDVIVKVYPRVIWEWTKENADGIISKIKDDTDELYVVLRDPVLTVAKRENGLFSIIGEPYYPDYDFRENVPTYLRDILNSSIYESELHVQGNGYSKIVCFDAANSYLGTMVYYVNSLNTVVRYYEYPTSESIDFALSDFQIYGYAFYQMQLRYGDLDGGASFSHFVANHSIEELTENTDKSNTNHLLWFVSIGVAVVVFATIGTVMYRKKKYNK